jgi:hypothetical protein
MKFAAIFSIIVGVGMIGQWMMSYFSKQIVELKTEPIRILFHIVAEMVTALCLIIGGIGLLLNLTWGIPVFLVGMGMLFYTSIVSPGYFAQKGNWIWLGMFIVIIICGIISIVLVI